MAIVKELFGAYQKGELPQDGGYIISSFFDGSSTYTKYEVTSYNNVKDIYVNEDGLVFQADGLKIFVLVEPASYPNKHVEPAYRDANQKIPYRQKEVDVYTSKRQDKIMVGREPIVTYTSFTVLKSAGNNFSYIIFKTDDILDSVQDFFASSLWKDARVPKIEADRISKEILVAFKKIMIVQ